MIRIRLILDDEGLLSSFRSTGHAGRRRERGDPACAAATALLRSAARTVAGHPGIDWEGDAPEPGRMSLIIRDCPSGDRSWLRGVTDVLLQGLGDLAGEVPESLTCTIETREREVEEHGT